MSLRRLVRVATLVVVGVAAGLGLASALHRGADSHHASGPLTIEITGTDYHWQIRYPGADGVLGSADDVLSARDVRIPVGTETVINLKSEDFLYLFALPDLALQQIAVPELTFSLNVHSNSRGIFKLSGDQLCGFAHDSLNGNLIVQSRRDFEAWLVDVASG